VKKRSLVWQIYPAYVVIAVVAVIAVAWYSSRTFRAFHYERTTRELRSAAYLVTEQLVQSAKPLDAPGTDVLCDAAGQVSGYRITAILPSGKVVGDSEKDPSTMDNHADRPEIARAMRGSVGTEIRHSDTLKMDMLYVAVPFGAAREEPAVVRTSVSLASIERALDRLWRRLAVAVLVLVAIVALATMAVARRISGPLAAIRAGAEAFGKGDLEGRLAPSDITEIDVLTATMNGMADQLNDRISTVTRQRDEQNALLTCMVEAVIALDNERRFIRLNDAAEKLFQVKTAECIGKNVFEVIRNADLLDIIDRTFESPEFVEGDVRLGDRDLYLQGHGSVLHGEDGRRIGALIVLNDITRLRKLEIVRRDFVANVSHELKTPITSIKGFVDTLFDTPVESDADREHFMAIIRRQTNRLQAIVEDLLSLSNIEHGAERDEIEFSEGCVEDVIQNAVAACEGRADAKRVALDTDCRKDMVGSINSQLLEQAVVNLIDNAIRYSDEGTRIEIACELREKEIAIHVRDEGCGISEKHLPRLFERFYRVDKARSRELGGTGLGLAVVKHIATAHGGRVAVESEPGKGSTFSIFLPAP